MPGRACVDRFLTPAERARAMGFNDTVLARIPPTKVIEALGNAMVLPCIGVVLACLLHGRIAEV